MVVSLVRQNKEGLMFAAPRPTLAFLDIVSLVRLISALALRQLISGNTKAIFMPDWEALVANTCPQFASRWENSYFTNNH